MPGLSEPRFRAWIEVDGVALPEYDVKTDPDGRTVRCWIPSEEGKNFVVHWEDGELASSTCGWVYVDGRNVRARIINHNNYAISRGRVQCEGSWLNETTLSLLKFGKMQLTDDESIALEDEGTIKALGTVELQIWRGSITGPSSFVPSYAFEERAVHEKMKKAGGHRVTRGESVVVTKGSWSEFQKDGLPFGVIFQYRPKEMLQALEIMPRDRQPSPLPQPTEIKRQSQGLKSEKRGRDPDEDSEGSSSDGEEDKEKIKQLKAQLAALEGRSKKRASAEKDGRKTKKAKIEEIDARTFFKPGEIIDLT